MKKTIVLCLFAILNSCFSYSQSRSLIVLDSVSKVPLKYASVNFLNGFGVYSDEDGQFTITDKTIASIEISHVSYDSKKISVSEINDTIILLTPKTIELNEIIVKRIEKFKTAKSLTVKSQGHKDYNKLYFSAIGLQLAFRINSAEKQSYLKNIEIPLLREKDDATRKLYPEKKYPYKTLIKIEVLESVNDSPGEKLYDFATYEIIDSEKIKNSFIYEFTEDIEIPENGLYIGVTFIGSVDESNSLIFEMPYSINSKYEKDLKFIKWLLPNIPIIERKSGMKTMYRFNYEKEPIWKQIEKPTIYFRNKEYPIFDVSIGYKVDVME